MQICGFKLEKSTVSKATIGIIADTHIPDRARRLPPAVLEVFKQANVAAILHAGDIVHPRVLNRLAQIAPTYAVRGNRDFYFLRRLPLHRQLTFANTKIALWHGHGSLQEYIGEKIRYFTSGKVGFADFAERAIATFPEAQVIIFGHTHYPICEKVGAHLICNPGSPTVPAFKWLAASIALLHLGEGEPRGELIYLPYH